MRRTPRRSRPHGTCRRNGRCPKSSGFAGPGRKPAGAAINVDMARIADYDTVIISEEAVMYISVHVSEVRIFSYTDNEDKGDGRGQRYRLSRRTKQSKQIFCVNRATNLLTNGAKHANK